MAIVDDTHRPSNLLLVAVTHLRYPRASTPRISPTVLLWCLQTATSTLKIGAKHFSVFGGANFATINPYHGTVS